MEKSETEEMEYIPVPKDKADADPISNLIRRIASVVRQWARDELSGRQKKNGRIDY